MGAVCLEVPVAKMPAVQGSGGVSGGGGAGAMRGVCPAVLNAAGGLGICSRE